MNTTPPTREPSFRWQNYLAAVLLTLPLFAGCGGELEEAEDSSEEALSGAFSVGTALMTTGNLNLRTTPSLSGTIIAVIPTGTRVLSAAANPRAGWYGVTWNGKTGWVSGNFLSRAGGTPSTFSRSEVRRLVRGHMRPGSELAADDFLDGGLTTQALVNAVGWLATHNPPAWEISAINSNHHFDPDAHSSGWAVDLYNLDPASDLAFAQLVNRDPFVVEVGLSGDYQRYRGEFPDKYLFEENAPTHIHLAVVQAFGAR